jgi:hypothetical protein
MTDQKKGHPGKDGSMFTTYSVNSNSFLFFSIRHDDICPSIESQQMGDCVCDPVAHEVTEQAWANEVEESRKAHRAAERAAAKAMRKAKS